MACEHDHPSSVREFLLAHWRTELAPIAGVDSHRWETGQPGQSLPSYRLLEIIGAAEYYGDAAGEKARTQSLPWILPRHRFPLLSRPSARLDQWMRSAIHLGGIATLKHT